MPDAAAKSLDRPDEVVEFPGTRARLVDLGDLTVGEIVTEPGWRWSTHVQPVVGGEWCQARHIGIMISGRLGVRLMDGTELEFEPNDVFDIPPGHDGWTIGDEPAVQIEWAGLRAFAGFLTGIRSRVLASLLFTDLVDSTATAAQLGDRRWRDLLSRHYESARRELDRFRGKEIDTTGDGLLARFDGPGLALHCAVAIRRAARDDGLRVRAGVHVGEVELVGDGLRGVAVHEAARIMAAAGPDEILVSEMTRALAGGSGLDFEDHGTHALKGLDGDWRLARLLADGE
jgi:class 3 adenylate cyclase